MRVNVAGPTSETCPWRVARTERASVALPDDGPLGPAAAVSDPPGAMSSRLEPGRGWAGRCADAQRRACPVPGKPDRGWWPAPAMTPAATSGDEAVHEATVADQVAASLGRCRRRRLRVLGIQRYTAAGGLELCGLLWHLSLLTAPRPGPPRPTGATAAPSPPRPHIASVARPNWCDRKTPLPGSQRHEHPNW